MRACRWSRSPVDGDAGMSGFIVLFVRSRTPLRDPLQTPRRRCACERCHHTSRGRDEVIPTRPDPTRPKHERMHVASFLASQPQGTYFVVERRRRKDGGYDDDERLPGALLPVWSCALRPTSVVSCPPQNMPQVSRRVDFFPAPVRHAGSGLGRPGRPWSRMGPPPCLGATMSSFLGLISSSLLRTNYS